MSLPVALTERIEEAHQALFRHPERMLLPWYRLAIYTALETDPPALASVVRAWLDVLAVRHVQFCWHPAAHGDWSEAWPTPDRLLAVAEQLLAGAADLANADALLNRAHAIADIVGVDASAPHYPSWCVYEAALRALASACSATHPLGPPLAGLTEDASSFAAIAVAGGATQPEGDDWWADEGDAAVLRRAVFWEWWLHEGIAQACNKARASIGRR